MKKLLILLFFSFIFQNCFCLYKIIIKDKKPDNSKNNNQTFKILKFKSSDSENDSIFLVSTNPTISTVYKNVLTDSVQNQNHRINRPFGINIGGTLFTTEKGTMFFTSLDYFKTHQIDLEVNIGTNFKDGAYYSMGGKFHLNSSHSNNMFTPFTGLLVGIAYGEGFFQIPVGINYLADSGFNASISLNEMLYINSWQTTFFELRIGWKFKR